jgi:Leucine-rich repeat (LRR) protein
MALLACSQLGITTNVQAALNYLKGAELTGTDKGWAVAQETTSDPVTTAFVVQALVSFLSLDGTLTTPIANGVSSLSANVSTASPIHIEALAALTYIRTGYPSYATSLLNMISASQSADGSWLEDPYATALAARAFAASMASDLASLSTVVYMPDANLRSAVNAALGRNSMDALDRGDMANLTSLTAVGVGISNLTGMEWAVNLTSANLDNNNITSTAPLAGLTQLTSLQLAGNPVAASAVPAMSVPCLILAALLILVLSNFCLSRNKETHIT